MATRASPSFAKAAKASRSASAVRGSTALRFAERSIVTIVTGPSFATMTLIGLAPLLGSVTRRGGTRSEEHTSELQSLMRISYAVFCLKKKKINTISKKQAAYNHHNTNREYNREYAD